MSMFAIKSRTVRLGAAAVALGVVALMPVPPSHAADAEAAAEATYADIEATLGGVPSFVKLFPKAGIAGAWQELKAIEFSEDTALSPKVKSLISLAVAAQIPCNYCVWADTMAARQAGATDAEIAEAVTMAALTRHWSTFFNGMQIDFDQFKMELGGEMAAAPQ
jgi:AhpD family alkylhydroperoxidase